VAAISRAVCKAVLQDKLTT